MHSDRFTVTHRGKSWDARAIGVSGTQVTVQFYDTVTTYMPASVLEFSLWDARCVQVPGMVLGEAVVELLRPWLKKNGCPWRIGWQRKKPQKKPKKEDPRQGKLFR